MDSDHLIAASKDELNLVLGFFPRVESRFSVILAIDTGMVGFLAASAPALNMFSNWMWIAGGGAVFLVAVSIGNLYRGSFPDLKGGESSLVYFREIAKRREQQFVDEFSKQTKEEYSKDLLCQAWR